MIFDKARMAKLSGLMTESSHKGIKNPMAKSFGGGDEEGDPLLDGEVTTEGVYEDEKMMDEMGDDEPHMEARHKKGHDDEEAEVREMIRKELRMAKEDMKQEKREEEAVREAVRKEIRSVMRSRGTTMGGVGWGFKR
jgi:hypothetical protein